MDAAMEISREICALCNLEKIIVFGQKSSMNSDAIRDVSLCLIADTDDKETLENTIYMSVDHDVSFNLLIYTPEEWNSLTLDIQSYAFRVVKKGTVIYERPI